MHALKLLTAALLAASHVASAAVEQPVITGGQGVNVPVAPAYEPPVPLLWKVSDDDNALYLLGSFHLLKEGDYPVAADIDTAFASADRIVFEVAPEQLEAADTSGRFLTAAAYEDGRTLSKVLTPRLREKLRRLLARQGGSLGQVDGYEPWFVNLSLLLGLAQSLGFSSEQGLDRHLIDRAAAVGKPTGGLETLQDQLDALDATPIEEQVIGLEDFLDRPQEMPGTLAELHQAWRDGDLERLDALTRLDMLQSTPETYRILNVERNDRWVPDLRSMLEDTDEDVLVVVGALHLLGTDGVVEQLRSAGYEVKRICSACDDTTIPGE